MTKFSASAGRMPSVIKRYGLAVLLVCCALLVTLLIQPTRRLTAPFFPAVILSTWFGGMGPGLLAVGLSSLALEYFFLAPTQQFAIDLSDLPHILAFTLSALFVSWLSAGRRRAEDSLRRAYGEMEAKVQERTADLSRSNEQLQNEIAERKRAHAEREQLLAREQAARAEAVAAQHRFRDLVNSVDGIVWEADAETFVFSFVNEQAERILGYSVERWLSEPTFWKDHVHPDDREWALNFCVTATAEKRDHDFEYRMIAADGRTVWLRDLVTVVVERDRATRLRGVMVDITERKRAEEAVREQANLLDLTHDTVFVRDMNDVITYWNRGAEELYGWTREQAVDKVSHQLTQTIFPAPLEEINAELLYRGRWEGELIHTRRDGTQVVVASRWSLQRDDHGQPAAILETNNDVTERRQAQEALEKAQAELAHVTRVTTLGELTASIAHEVSQPLAAVVMNANASLRWLAGERPNLNETRANLERIVRDGHRASEVIGRIRALVKKPSSDKSPLDVNELTREVVTLAQSAVQKNQVLLRTELAADLPAVMGDRVQLQQVILNLIMNGIEAMNVVRDRPRELVIKTQKDEAGKVLVAVQDSGVGLDSQAMDRIFQAFYTTKCGGMGMGLSISRSIIEAHGGKVSATANDGPGATFQFTLPNSQ